MHKQSASKGSRNRKKKSRGMVRGKEDTRPLKDHS